MKKAVIAMATAALLSGCAGTVTIKNNPGGELDKFYSEYGRLAKASTNVRISGYCNSSCTVALVTKGITVCAEEGATFGFHRPYVKSLKANAATQAYLDNEAARLFYSYPASVQKVLTEKGWPDAMRGASPNEVTTVKATDIIPLCK